jgi:hypothetical protein
VALSVKVTEEYAAWFSALIKEDLASAIQVAGTKPGTGSGGTGRTSPSPNSYTWNTPVSKRSSRHA